MEYMERLCVLCGLKCSAPTQLLGEDEARSLVDIHP